MKKVHIAGMGMSRSTLTLRGEEAVRSSGLIIGAKRMLGEFPEINAEKVVEFRGAKIAGIVQRYSGEVVTVLVSGDTGFFSAADGLIRALSGVDTEVEVIPGISSMSYFFAKAGIPWQNAAHISCHGRDCNVADYVRRNRYTFILTGGNTGEIGAGLVRAGFEGLPVLIGENLGRESESIKSALAEELETMDTASLTVLLVCNPSPDDSVPSGIPDSRFIRRDVPMTKSEIRSVVMSRLALRPEETFVDIGAGTGSVTVEAGLALWKGKVFAVEKNADAADLISQNCRKFHVGNVNIINGTAPEALEEIDIPDAAFIGGSSGKTEEIVRALCGMNPDIRIVITAIAIESLYNAVNALSSVGMDPEACQISAARSRKAGSLHMMTGQNPIFVISAGGKNE